MNEEFSVILTRMENILDSICEKQKLLREAVNNKNWTELMSLISAVNLLSDAFKFEDSKREKIQASMKRGDLSTYTYALSILRTKLLRCKAENKAFASYVNITRSFVQQVVERALPQSRNKNYSRTGHILQPQPQSVVVNQLF
jgi:hypothetical protein